MNHQTKIFRPYKRPMKSTTIIHLAHVENLVLSISNSSTIGKAFVDTIVSTQHVLTCEK